MRKLGWILGGLFVVIVTAAVSVPLFVDVDQYRPVILAEANKRINGQLELGKLKLSLWGAVKIHADSIKLSVNGFPEPLLDTKEFHLEIPFLSILGGSPQLIAVLESPKIGVLKNSSGKTNVFELMKKDGQSSASNSSKADRIPADTTSAPAAAPSTSVAVPALLVGARLGLRIRDGDLAYADKLANSSYQVLGLDLDAKNLGLGSEMEIGLKAPLKGSTPAMTFEGPVSAEAKIQPMLSGNTVKSVSGKIDLDASKLKVEMKGGTFRKTDGMPLKLDAQFIGSEQETLLRGLDLQFADFKFHGKGRILSGPLSAKLEITTDPGTIRLEKLQAFVPMLEQYQLRGLTDFSVSLDWKPEALRASGDLKISDGSFFVKDMLKAPLQFRLQTGFSESSLNITRASLSGPDTEVELTGSVRNFLAPQFTAALTGKSFNVDKTLVLPSEAQGKSAALFSLIPQAYAEKAADVNPMLALAKNPAVANAAGVLTAKLGKIVVYGANLEQLNAKFLLQSMVLKLQDGSFRTFSGQVKTVGEFDLKSPGLLYRSQGNVVGISAKEAMKSYFPKYQNTLEGMVDASWNVSGSAYPASSRIRNLKGTAKLMAKDGSVKSVDFQESINAAISKVPFLKNQKPIKVDNGFKSLSADVKMDNGTIHAEPIEILPKGQGFVVKGKSSILESLEQDTYLDVYDPQNQLPKEFHSPGKPAIPLRIFGPLTSPKTDYEYTVKKLASTAGQNALKEQAFKVLGVDNSPGKSDKDKLKDAADQLRKKFGF